ncbi:GWxTD domain-containing protein [Pontibacter sp. BT327]|uniref:GWxTD domain-containing protein n=2 Tax=Pontibacter burrus TaxID=2704466 RepID=A0A6B3LSB8_9BACT|nr:GWxTD domain-containing protein [Pontibacter burrus]
MQYTYQAGADSLKLYFLFSDVSRLMQLQRSASNMTYDVTANDTKAILLRDTVKVATITGPGSPDEVIASISIPNQLVAASNTLQVKLWQEFAGQARMQTAFKVQLQPYMLTKQGILLHKSTGKPLLRGYMTTSDSLVLQSTDTASMLIYRFNADILPALPPMSTRKEAVPTAVKPLDSTIVAAADTFMLPQEGLYLLWPRSEFSRGLVVRPWYFPQVTMARELLDPLIYLTTSTERERMFNAPDVKKAVDDFWMEIAGEKQLARELIRTYYGRVEEANKLYTSFKPGWATDRGMIYLIYGPPSDVSRVGNTETWIYRETEMQLYVRFVFTKKQNNFTENHYELIRRREYEESWYSTVAKWRAGITDM